MGEISRFCLRSIKGINGNERMVNFSKAKRSIALSLNHSSWQNKIASQLNDHKLYFK